MMADDALRKLKDTLPPPPGSIGFIKVPVPRCTSVKKNGGPCQAPAKRGTSFCVNHAWMGETYPGVAIVAADATLGDKQAITRTQTKIRKTVIDEMLAIAEKDPKRIFKPLFDALEATKTVYNPLLQADVQTTSPDWDVRLKAVDMLMDRLYGKAKARTEVTGAEGGPVNIAAVVLQLAQKATEHEVAEKAGDLEAYYTSIPGEEIEDAEIVDAHPSAPASPDNSRLVQAGDPVESRPDPEGSPLAAGPEPE